MGEINFFFWPNRIFISLLHLKRPTGEKHQFVALLPVKYRLPIIHPGLTGLQVALQLKPLLFSLVFECEEKESEREREEHWELEREGGGGGEHSRGRHKGRERTDITVMTACNSILLHSEYSPRGLFSISPEWWSRLADPAQSHDPFFLSFFLSNLKLSFPSLLTPLFSLSFIPSIFLSFLPPFFSFHPYIYIFFFFSSFWSFFLAPLDFFILPFLLPSVFFLLASLPSTLLSSSFSLLPHLSSSPSFLPSFSSAVFPLPVTLCKCNLLRAPHPFPPSLLPSLPSSLYPLLHPNPHTSLPHPRKLASHFAANKYEKLAACPFHLQTHSGKGRQGGGGAEEGRGERSSRRWRAAASEGGGREGGEWR